MKKLLPLFTICSLIGMPLTTVTAQITVNEYDVVGISSQVIQARDTLPSASIQPGAPGTSLTWDFSGLANHEEDTMNFTNPNWTPHGAYHPGSNLAAQQNSDDFYIYLTNNSSGLYMDGFSGDLMGGGTASHAPANPSEIIAEFPLNYNDSWSGYSEQMITMDGSGMGVDSVRLKFAKTKSVLVDAWGSVTTPLGTFAALRLNEDATETDSTWTYTGITGWILVNDGSNDRKNYAWWTDDNAAGFPLVEMEYDTAAGTANSASYLKATPSTGVTENLKASVKTYPNPAAQFVTLEMDVNTSGTVFVYSAMGQLVEQISITGTRTNLNVSGYNSGEYVFLVKDNDQIVNTGRFIVR